MRKDFVKMKVIVHLIGKQNNKAYCYITKTLCNKKFIHLTDMSVYLNFNNEDFGTLLFKFFE